MGRLYVVLLLILLAISIFVMGCNSLKDPWNEISGRYHQRTRVGNFFDRGDMVADRGAC